MPPIQDPSVGLPRTNPQAHEQNHGFAPLGIEIIGDVPSFQPTWNYAVTGAGALLTITPTAGHNAPGIKYFKFRLLDEDGKEVFGAVAVPAATPLAINTSTLDPLKSWRVEFTAEVVVGKNTGRRNWWLKFPAGSVLSNPSGSGQNV